MTPGDYLLLALVLASTLFFLYRIVLAARQFIRFRGQMLVTCPETHRAAAVKVDNWQAVLSPASSHRLQLSACSRWPERRQCGQECLCQIEEDPESHRLWSIAAQWYDGKDCAYCGHPIHLGQFDHPPALMDADKKVAEWLRLAPENLQDAFAASMAVCWNCYITENFIREHPDRIVVRPWKHSPPWARN
jgi:hypothetical protein